MPIAPRRFSKLTPSEKAWQGLGGVAVNDAPKAVFPPIVVPPTMPGITEGMDRKDGYVATGAERARQALGQPIDHSNGQVQSLGAEVSDSNSSCCQRPAPFASRPRHLGPSRLRAFPKPPFRTETEQNSGTPGCCGTPLRSACNMGSRYPQIPSGAFQVVHKRVPVQDPKVASSSASSTALFPRCRIRSFRL